MSDQENDGAPKRKRTRMVKQPLQSLSLPTVSPNVQLQKRNTRTQVVPIVDDDFTDCTAAGVIKKVELINFMCHSHFEISFNPRLNFITGVNGSGKSAIQTAIVIGLGGAASKTNRSSKAEGLIKHGCNSSKIEITLRNEGQHAYKEEEYGREIRVIRNINRTSSTYKILNEWGKTVSTKKGELENIIMNFRIQINNPVVVLNQDMARNFLSANKSESKYLLFKKATLLEQVEQKLQQINIEISEQKEQLTLKDRVVERIQEEIDRMSVKVKLAESLRQKKQEKFNLEAEIMWSNVNVDKDNLTRLESKREEQDSIKNEAEIKAEKVRVEIRKFEEQINQLKETLNSMRDESRKKEGNINEIKLQYKSKRNAYENKCTEYERINGKLKNKKADLNRIEASLDEIDREETLHKEKKKEIAEKVEKLKEAINDNQSKIEKVEMDAKSYQNTGANYSDQIKDKTRIIAKYKGEINESETRIRDLAQADDLSIYAKWMPELIQQINLAVKQKKFSKPPRGPIGRYIKIKDQKWKAVIETNLGEGFLTSFFVNNAKDRDLLYKIMNEVLRGQRKPTVHCSSFQEEIRHNMSSYETNSDPYTNMYRTISVKDTVVSNFLVDMRNIHQVLLVDKKDQCRAFFRDDENIPQNCRLALDLEANQYLPGFRVYSQQGRLQSKLLQKSVGDFIRQLKEDVAYKQNLISEATIELSEIQIHHKSSIEKAKQMFDILQNYKQQVTRYKRQITELQNSVDMEMPSLQDKLSELQSIKEEIVQLEHKKTNVDEERNSYLAEMKNVKKALDSISFNDTTGEEATINGKIESISKQLPLLKAKEGKFLKIIEEQRLKMSNLEDRIKELGNKVRQASDSAGRLSQETEFEEIRSPKDIQAELDAVKMFIDEATKSLGTDQLNFEKEYWDKQDQHKSFLKMFNEAKTMHAKYWKMYEDRKGLIEKIRDLSASVVFAQFQAVLNSRNYTGRLIFDHIREKLEILLASTDGEDGFMNTNSLSGGEKSFSTVAFLMALWSSMDHPFYSLDEYDVFMDAINRKTVTELLMAFASASKTKQYLFLSPLDVSIIQTGADVEVHRVSKIM